MKVQNSNFIDHVTVGDKVFPLVLHTTGETHVYKNTMIVYARDVDTGMRVSLSVDLSNRTIGSWSWVEGYEIPDCYK